LRCGETVSIYCPKGCICKRLSLMLFAKVACPNHMFFMTKLQMTGTNGFEKSVLGEQS